MVTGMDAESLFLSMVLREPAVLDRVERIVPSADMLSKPDHRVIYGVALEAYREMPGVEPDLILRRLVPLKKSVLGVELLELTASTAMVEHHAEEVRRQSILNSLVKGCERAVENAKRPGADPMHILADLERMVTADTVAPVREFHTVGYGIEDWVDAVLSGTGKQGSYILTPIGGVNDMVGGLYKGEVIFVGAMPSMGKTSFTLQLAWEQSLVGKKVAFFSLDQTKDDIQRRLTAYLSGIPVWAMKSGKVYEQSRPLMESATTKVIGNPNLFVMDKPGLSALEVVSACRRLKRQHGLDVIVVDYFQQLRMAGKFDRHDLAVAASSGAFKVAAKELDVVVILLSQFSRTYQGMKDSEKPQMTWMRDSGALEQDANVILFPWIPLELIRRKYGRDSQQYRDKAPADGVDPVAEIIVAKNKDGETGEVACRWNAMRMKFYEDQQAIEERPF